MTEPTEAEALVIACMKAKHPTWTAHRYRDGWHVCWRVRWQAGGDFDVPAAWDPDILAAWLAAEDVLAYTQGGPVSGRLPWWRRLLESFVGVAALVLVAIALMGFLAWTGH